MDAGDRTSVMIGAPHSRGTALTPGFKVFFAIKHVPRLREISETIGVRHNLLVLG